MPDTNPSPTPAELAWAEHSIGFTWADQDQQYAEFRAFLAGYDYDRAAEKQVEQILAHKELYPDGEWDWLDAIIANTYKAENFR